MDWISLGLLGLAAWWCIMRCVGIPEGKPFRKLCWGDKLALIIPWIAVIYYFCFVILKVTQNG